ncbi:MAG: flippase [Patescibacteria group bacterium]
MSLLSKIAKNTFYQIVSKALGTLLGLFTVGLMTRYLGQTGYGYFTTAISFLQFFAVLSDFGLQMVAAQMLSKPAADQEKIFKNILALRFFSSLIFLGSGTIIAWCLPYSLLIKQGITIVSLSFLFISLQTVLISVFQKNLEMSRVALAEIWGRLALLIGAGLTIYFQAGLIYLIWSVVVGNLLSLVILLVSGAKRLAFGFAFDLKIWKKVFDQAWPLSITIALTLVYFRADMIILSLSRPANEVGLYGAAYRVLDVLVQFPYLFLGLLLPILTKFFVTSKEAFKNILQKSFDLMAIIVWPMVLASLVLGEKIMVLIAGADFLPAGQIIKLLTLAAAAIYFSALFGYAIVAAELQKKMIKFYLFNAALALILYVILIPLYSYWAAAWLTVLSEALMALFAFHLLRKNLNVSFKFKIFTKAALAGLIMSLVLLALISQNLVTLIIIGLLVYFFMLYALRGIEKKTILEIMKFKN